MKKMALLIAVILFSIFSMGTSGCGETTQDALDRQTSDYQLSQYSKRQPVPTYNWSLERELVRKLYDLRNQKVATHSVWRSDLGTIEGDCPSIGFGLPYDTSLTNPLKIAKESSYGIAVTEQHEPNGIFASKNTAATWVMCAGPGGSLEPHYIETRVTVYPYPIKVDYEHNRVTRAGKAVTIDVVEK